jgi:TetR/AcrR family transcriptional regulator
MHTTTTSVSNSHGSVERILAAAEAMFAEKGFDGVSMNAIAVRAGISKANVFHHFNTKDALYLEVVKAACQRSQKILDALVKSSGDFSERLGHFAAAHLKDVLDHDNTSRLVLRQILEGESEKTQILADEVFNERFSRIVNMVRDAQKRGEVRRNIDPAMVATLLVGADVFYFLAAPVMKRLDEVKFAGNPEAYTRMTLDILLNGISRPVL